MNRLALIGGGVLFLAGAVFGGVVSQGNGGTISSATPAPTVTVTATETVTQYALTPECEEALRQAEVTLAASVAVSGTVGGLEQIISDTKRASALDDVPALSAVQVQLRDYELANSDSFRELGIAAATLEEAITTCKNS